MSKKHTNQNQKHPIYFLCFLFIFFLNNLSDIIYYKVEFFKTHSLFIYFKLLEISVFVAYAMLVLCFMKFKKLINLSTKSLDFYKGALTFTLLIFYSECEFSEILNYEHKNYRDFSFIIGIFIITSLQHIENLKLKMFFLALEMMYLAVRFFYIYDLHLQRISTLTFSFMIYYKFEDFLKKKDLEGTKEDAKQSNEFQNSFFLRILKECNEEAIAIFDNQKILLFSNNKLRGLIKTNEEAVNKDILNIHLNFVSLKIKNKYPGLTNFNRHISIDQINTNINLLPENNHIQDFLSSDKEFTLEVILDELVSSLIVPNDNQIETMHLAFSISKVEELQIEENVLNLKLILTVICRNGKIEGFLISVAFTLDYDSLMIKEKKYQNDKTYFVSHEMRTPLNCIVSMLQMLKTLIKEDLVEDYISPAIVSCNFLLYLIQDLLDMAQIESNNFTMNFEEFDIRMLIDDIVELFKLQATSKNAEINHNFSNNVPEVIVSDHRRIRQILINLIGNALKFLKKSNGKVTIDISVNPFFHNYIILAVKDNGIGIKEEDKIRLFTAFGKIKNDENKKMNSNGVGLGLMISNTLAINLHPTKSSGLKVESEYGFGTSFSLEIEDKNEANQITDYVNEKNLNDRYQVLLSNVKIKKFKKKINSKQHENEESEESSKREESQCLSSKQSLPSLKNLTDYSAKFRSFHFGHQVNSINKNSKYSFINKTDSINTSKKLPTFLSKISLSHKKCTNTNISYMTNLKTGTINQTQIKNYYLKKRKKLFFSTPSMISFGDSFLTKKDSEDVEAAEKEMMVMKEIISRKPCKCSDILICDDNAFNIYSLRKQLEFFNFRVDSANDGEEAISKVKEFYNKGLNCCKSYYLIFMDIEMPVKNGYESSSEIKKFYQTIPDYIDSKIISCSAHIIEQDPGKYKQCGMEEFVTKPIIKGRLMLF